MDLLYVSAAVALLCTILVISLKYLSLLRWISGKAYVFSKIEGRLTPKDVLGLLKFSKPFPVSCQKGWKIESFSHGHRVWFHFLTQPEGQVLNNVKVFATYSKVRASSQFVLQLLKDISLTCQWKPGVIATSFVLPASSTVAPPTKSRPAPHVHHDIIKEERIAWPRPSSQSLVTETVTEVFTRYSNREDNGCCWLLQINEAAQKWTFYLAQPVEETDQCILSIINHCGHDDKSNYCSRNLSSLEDFLIHRKLSSTPLSSLTLPSPAQIEADEPVGDADTTKRTPTRFLTRVKSFMSGSSGRMFELEKSELKRYNSILKYRTPDLKKNDSTTELDNRDDSRTEHPAVEETPSSNNEGSPVRNIPLTRTPSDPNERNYKTLANQAAGELLAETIKASNIELDKPAEQQVETSNGWMFTGIENDVVILKKAYRQNSSIQSYIGKGLVQAPPKTVWENLKNPRTRFTYDETLKKVEVLENVSDGMKVVYQYHEVQQLLRKDCCEMCVLQSERRESDKYILSYQSVDYEYPQSADNCAKPRLLASGWIIEPARKDKRIYSIVTYLMQMDFGARKANTDKMPFEDLVSRQPLSIFYLQQYLHPAVMLSRQLSV